MFETMYASHGIGLAAPQIDIGKRLTVIDVSGAEEEQEPQRIVLINPEVISKEGRQTGEEGCLSIPGFREPVTRAKKTLVRAQRCQRGHHRSVGRGSAGPLSSARDRSPERCSLHQPPERAQTRPDQAQDKKTAEGGRMGMTRHLLPLAHARSSAQTSQNRDREGAATQGRFAREVRQ